MCSTPVPPPTIDIVLVEDSADDAELIAIALRRAGLACSMERVETAAGLRAALSERRPDLLVCDYHLPGFGFDQALAIARELAPGVPVLLASHHVTADEASRALAGGAVGYVGKGRLTDLAPAVLAALGRAAP